MLSGFGNSKDVIPPEKHVRDIVILPGEKCIPSGREKNCRTCSSNIYSLGIIIVQILTGLVYSEIPKDRGTGALLWERIETPGVWYRHILERMTKTDAYSRYESTQNILADLIVSKKRISHVQGRHAIKETLIASSGLASQSSFPLEVHSRNEVKSAAPVSVTKTPSTPLRSLFVLSISLSALFFHHTLGESLSQKFLEYKFQAKEKSAAESDLPKTNRQPVEIDTSESISPSIKDETLTQRNSVFLRPETLSVPRNLDTDSSLKEHKVEDGIQKERMESNIFLRPESTGRGKED